MFYLFLLLHSECTRDVYCSSAATHTRRGGSGGTPVIFVPAVIITFCQQTPAIWRSEKVNFLFAKVSLSTPFMCSAPDTLWVFSPLIFLKFILLWSYKCFPANYLFMFCKSNFNPIPFFLLISYSIPRPDIELLLYS